MFSEPNRVQQKSFTAKVSKVQVDTDEAARSEDEIVETGFFRFNFISAELAAKKDL